MSPTSRSDDPYDAWGQDRRVHPDERLWWRDMTAGLDDEYHRGPLHPSVADREFGRRDEEADG